MGRGDAGAHEPRDALQPVHRVDPEPHPPRCEWAVESDDRTDERRDGRAYGRRGTPEILPLRTAASE